MVDEKKEFLKKLCFVFRRGMLCIFRVEHNKHLAEKIFRIFIFQELIKKGKVFYTSVDLERTLIPILERFLLKYTLLLLLRLDMGYIE